MSGADDLHAYYEQGAEVDRLDEPAGQVEFLRTTEVLSEHLPLPPAVVADVGGGPGRYALWLAELGYDVHHRDRVPLHVEQLRGSDAGGRVDSAVCDARALDLPDASVDAVLLLGPLYHLAARTDRVQALAEARRVGRPGALVVAAAISRWAPRLDGVLTSGSTASTRRSASWSMSPRPTGCCRRCSPGRSPATRTAPTTCARR